MQVAAANHLQEKVKKTVEGRAKLGIDAFAQALLGIPKTLAENSGYDAQEAVIKLQVGFLARKLHHAEWLSDTPTWLALLQLHGHFSARQQQMAAQQHTGHHKIRVVVTQAHTAGSCFQCCALPSVD